MTREDFLRMLALLVEDGALTEGEAAELLRAYDAGRISADLLPLAPREAGVILTQALAAAALRQAAPQIRGAVEAARSLPLPTRQRIALQRLPEAFGREVDRRTALLYMSPEEAGAARRSAGSVRRWHTAMKQAVSEDLLAAAQLGAGRPLTELELARLQRIVDQQHAYLSRFADEIAARKALAEEGIGKALSQKQIAARMKMYQGPARGEFFRFSEGEMEAGFVVYYRAQDDKGTCSPCYEAERAGPYLPQEGPMPGEICLGRGLCRCVREPVFSPEEYARLAGQPPPVVEAMPFEEVTEAAGVPTPTFATVEEAEAWARENVSAEVEWKLGDMNPEVAEVVLDELRVLRDEYPETFGHLRVVDATTGGSTHVTSRPGGGSVLNIGRYEAAQRLESLDRDTLRMHERGFSVAKDYRGIIRHEFGHVLDNRMMAKEEAVWSQVTVDGRITFRDVYLYADRRREVLEAVRRPGAVPSDYALKNISEVFAEAFTEMGMKPRSQWSEATEVVYELIQHGLSVRGFKP